MKFEQTNLRRLLFSALLVSALMGQKQSDGQNVYKDYVRDRNAQYSPCDHKQRGLIYRLHTGHAGIFGDCDDDREKLNSPYIDWHCRKSDCSLPGQFINEMFADLFRKNERMTDGAGACVWGRCGTCNQQSAHCQCNHSNLANSRAMEVAPESELSNARQETSGRKVRPSHRQTVSRRVQPQEQSSSRYRYASNASQPKSKAYSTQQQNNQYRSIYERHASTADQRTTSHQRLSLDQGVRNSYFAESQEVADPGRAVATEARVSQTSYRNERESNQKELDPRFNSNQRLVPENRFERFEKRIQLQQQPNQLSRNSSASTFRLSGGRVFNVPATSSQFKQSKQTPDPQEDPQYFQFQRIGGSENR